jgi:hypothetical protein
VASFTAQRGLSVGPERRPSRGLWADRRPEEPLSPTAAFQSFERLAQRLFCAAAILFLVAAVKGRRFAGAAVFAVVVATVALFGGRPRRLFGP